MPIGANAATMFTESVTYFYISFAFLALIALMQRKGSSTFWMIVFGVFSGMYLITRAAIVLFIAGFLILWILLNIKDWRKAAVQTFAAGMCIMCFMGPWIVRNYIVHHELIIFNTASDNPLFKSTIYDGMGPSYLTEEEEEKFDYTFNPQLGPWAGAGDIARFRIQNARKEWGLEAFIYVRYTRKIFNYPNQPTLMLYSNDFLQTRGDLLGNREYNGPFAGDFGGRFWQYTLFVHKMTIVFAIVGLAVGMIRAGNGKTRLTLLVLGLFPIYMLAVHLHILYLPRYMYQSLPATFVLVSGVALLLPRKPLLSYFSKSSDDCSDDASDSKLSLTVNDQR